MSHRNTPFLRLIVPFSLGIAAGDTLREAPEWVSVLLFALLCATTILAVRRYQYRHRWMFGASLYACLLVGGYVLMVGNDERLQERYFAAHLASSQYFLCTVYEAPSCGNKVKVPVRLQAMGVSTDSLMAVQGQLLLFLDPSAATDSLRYGHQLVIRGSILPTEPPRNPHAFDYRRYLHYKNIHYQCFVKPDSFLVTATGLGNPAWRLAYHCRDRLLALLKRHFPTADEYAVASALLLGYQEDLSDELRTAYAETGSMHALAVSGSHVGMLYMGLIFLTQRLRLRGRWKLLETFFILAVIWGFTILTGATASVLRASVMFTAYLLGKAFWRNASAWNVLPASAFGLLLFNPGFLYDVGFQLSYAAVAGMVFFYPRLYKLFPPGPRWADEALKVLLVGVSAQLGTLPLSLYYFSQFPVYFWLAGWLVVLGGAVFLWGGAVLVLLDALSETLANGLGTGLYYMLWALNKAILFIQHLPGSVVASVWIPGWVAGVLYGCLVLLGMLMVRRRGRWLAAFFGVMTLLGLYRMDTLQHKRSQRTMVVYHLPRQQRLIDFIDGGQLYALSDTLTVRQELFAAKSNRIASGVQQNTHIPLGSSTVFQSDNLLIDKPLIQFFQQKIALIDGTNLPAPGLAPPVPVATLVLTKNPRITLAACREMFPFDIVVFDASNSARRVAAWREECDANGWLWHDVRTQGAWVHEE